MSKVSANSSIGAKLKAFSEYENISVHASISIEKDVSSDLADDDLVTEAGVLYEKCRSYVESKVNEDIESAKGKGKKIG